MYCSINILYRITQESPKAVCTWTMRIYVQKLTWLHEQVTEWVKVCTYDMTVPLGSMDRYVCEI